jgi:hypothetical protein
MKPQTRSCNKETGLRLQAWDGHQVAADETATRTTPWALAARQENLSQAGNQATAVDKLQQRQHPQIALRQTWNGHQSGSRQSYIKGLTSTDTARSLNKHLTSSVECLQEAKNMKHWSSGAKLCSLIDI